MMDSSAITQMLTTIGFFLPDAIGFGVALIVLMTNAHSGQVRRWGVIGVSVMLLCTGCGLALTLYQNHLIAAAAGNVIDMAHYFGMIAAIRMLLNIVSMAGFLLVIWALCKATQRDAAQV